MNNVIEFFNKKKKHCRDEEIRNTFERGLELGNNVVTRHLQPTIHALDQFDDKIYSQKTFHHEKEITCYGCSKLTKTSLCNYLYSCLQCGKKYATYRHLTSDLSDRVALVTGARTKLGHCVTLKLLRAGATVIGTTRYPILAQELYEKYPDYSNWSNRLFIYTKPFDMFDIEKNIAELYTFINSSFQRLDILINNAAQTIRWREQSLHKNILHKNRYGDSAYVQENAESSWQLNIQTTSIEELKEVMQVNAIAPFILTQSLLPLLKKSKTNPFLINVHAREGKIVCNKSGIHPHTNMAKSALAMLTKTLFGSKIKTESGKKLSVHGCDPGWISIDEYKIKDSSWIVPPIDEIDGAARVLFPIFTKMTGGSPKTRSHFDDTSY